MKEEGGEEKGDVWRGEGGRDRGRREMSGVGREEEMSGGGRRVEWGGRREEGMIGVEIEEREVGEVRRGR